MYASCVWCMCVSSSSWVYFVVCDLFMIQDGILRMMCSSTIWNRLLLCIPTSTILPKRNFDLMHKLCTSRDISSRSNITYRFPHRREDTASEKILCKIVFLLSEFYVKSKEFLVVSRNFKVFCHNICFAQTTQLVNKFNNFDAFALFISSSPGHIPIEQYVHSTSISTHNQCSCVHRRANAKMRNSIFARWRLTLMRLSKWVRILWIRTLLLAFYPIFWIVKSFHRWD